MTNVATGKSVVVRVNDRGPFLHGRIIDLSYAAANRIGIAAKGSGEVEVEAIIPGEGRTLAAAPPLPPVVPRPPPRGATTAPLRREPPQAAPVSVEAAGGFAVQLGAFQNYNNAQTFLAHVQAQLATAQVEPKVREAERAVPRLRGPVSRSRRGAAGGGPPHQRVRLRHGDRAALSLRLRNSRAGFAVNPSAALASL